MKISTVYTYANTGSKITFAEKAITFFKEACTEAFTLPDVINELSSPATRYPYYNPGGPAVLGDVYCNVTRPDRTTLEMIIGESGFLYRTKKNGQYGNNNWPLGLYNSRVYASSDYNHKVLAEVIKKFMES